MIDSLAEGLEGSSGRHKFHITEACLFIALDLTEEALLDESVGEAAAGLLRAWCTGTKAGSRGEGVALAGGDRWKEERGVMSPLIALLDEVQNVYWLETFVTALCEAFLFFFGGGGLAVAALRYGGVLISLSKHERPMYRVYIVPTIYLKGLFRLVCHMLLQYSCSCLGLIFRNASCYCITGIHD